MANSSSKIKNLLSCGGHDHCHDHTLSEELKEHIPFTLIGALSGIILMVIFNKFFSGHGDKLFRIFHPLHVILSAFATTMLYRLRAPKSSLLKLVIIGYVGAIGVATISDCVIPYCGERIMGIAVPSHSHDHTEHGHEEYNHAEHVEEAAAHPSEDEHDEYEAMDDHDHTVETTIEHDEHDHLENAAIAEKIESHDHRHVPGKPDIHIGFIEDWKTVNSAAILGIILGIFFTAGKLPHTSHVLVSTWASMAHIMMNTANHLTPMNYLGIFVVLFIAVWLPCCLSDIVFPTLFSLKSINPDD